MTIQKIGVMTGGGDCPGLNAVIRAVVLGAKARGWEVLGVEDLHTERLEHATKLPVFGAASGAVEDVIEEHPMHHLGMHRVDLGARGVNHHALERTDLRGDK